MPVIKNNLNGGEELGRYLNNNGILERGKLEVSSKSKIKFVFGRVTLYAAQVKIL
jgi:hypothetical protein